jgi:uncharacterized membrane protein
MKKYFITGLIILLPLALTIGVFVFIFNFLTEPFVGIFDSILQHYGIADIGLLFWSHDEVQNGVSRILILCFLFFFTVALGVVARWFFVHYFLQFWDYLIRRIPLISSVYKTFQDVIKTLFTSNTKSFKQVVMVRFPNKDSYSIGLVTRENMSSILDNEEPMVTVFVPTTPNPTCGFMMIYKESDLVYLDMKVEDAFKYIISCGVIQPNITELKREKAESLLV